VGAASKKSNARAVLAVFINWSAPGEQQEKSRGGEGDEGPEQQCRQDAKAQGSGKRGNGAGRLLGRKGRIEYTRSSQLVRRPASAGGGSLRLKFLFEFGKVVGHGENATPFQKYCLEEPKDRFDGDPVRDGAVRGILRRHEFPAANGLLRAFIKPQPNSLHDANLRGAPIGPY